MYTVNRGFNVILPKTKTPKPTVNDLDIAKLIGRLQGEGITNIYEDKSTKRIRYDSKLSPCQSLTTYLTINTGELEVKEYSLRGQPISIHIKDFYQDFVISEGLTCKLEYQGPLEKSNVLQKAEEVINDFYLSIAQ